MMTTLTVQDVFSFGAKPNKKIEKDAVLPFVIVPILFLVSSLSRPITIVVMIITGMGALYVQSRPRQKNRSTFFVSWTLSSGVWMFLVFEIAVLRLLEITQLENLTFLILVTFTCYFFYKMKSIADFELATGTSKGKEYSPVLTSDSHYCQICQIEVNDRFFHSIWWNCCVLRQNYIYFFVGLIFAFLTILYGTNLGLTTVCHPFLLYGAILLPENCEDVYSQFQFAISFVACVYGLGYLCILSFVLLRHIFVFLPKYVAPQWKRITNDDV